MNPTNTNYKDNFYSARLNEHKKTLSPSENKVNKNSLISFQKNDNALKDETRKRKISLNESNEDDVGNESDATLSPSDHQVYKKIKLQNTEDQSSSDSLNDALSDFMDNKEESLRSLFKSGQLMNLSPTEKSEIFDRVLVESHNEFVLEAVKLGLSLSERDDALTYALNSNDYSLAKAAIEGVAGQEPIDFITRTPVLWIETLKGRGADPSLISYLFSISSLEQIDLEQVEWTKFLSNLWGIDEGEFNIKGEKIEYGGTFPHFFTDKILESFKSFQIDFSNLLDKDLIEEISFLIDGARRETSIEELIKRYTQKKPILIHGGDSEHQLEVYLQDRHLLICNKGCHFAPPVKAYNIDSTKLLANHVKRIKESVIVFSEEQGIRFFYKELPCLLNNLKDPSVNKKLTSMFTDNWLGNQKQDKENCVWESMRTAISAASAMYRWRNNDNDYEMISSFLKEIQMWDHYFHIWGIEKYLEHFKQNPSRIDRHLLDRIFSEANIFFRDRDLSWKHKIGLLKDQFTLL